MNNRILIIFLIILINNFFSISVFSEELQIKADQLKTKKNGNMIFAENNAEAKIKNKIEIYADKIIFDKLENLLIAKGNALVVEITKNIKINSNEIYFYQNKNQVLSKGESFFNIDEKYKIESKDVVYNLNDEVVSSNFKSIIKDNNSNILKVSKFKYFKNSNHLSAKNIELIDFQNNKYFLDNGIINLEKKILIGKDVEAYLANSLDTNKENEPRIKGNSFRYQNKNTYIGKGVFTSCKNEGNCPPWSIESDEIVHDKKKQEIIYKDAWLKIYDFPVLYFPKFFHPDPSVDRKSGFLQPSINNSKTLGSSITTPYFNAISTSKDLTFTPRFFSSSEYLLQTEYREKNKKSSHILDFSINKSKLDDSNGRKTHFFSTSKFKLDKNKFFNDSLIDLKIEKTSNDNYLNLYNIASSSLLVKNKSTLENSLSFSGANTNNDLTLDISLESYEQFYRLNSDKYEFVYPNYSLSKGIELDNKLFSSLDFVSSGSQKTYSTNIYEAIQVNDIFLGSENFYNKFGLSNKVNLLFKNVNSNGKNSSKLKNNNESEILSMISYDLNLPLTKNNNNLNKKFLTPKASLRFSPNDSKNIKNENRLIDTSNLFSINRIGYNETIEGGSSLTIGLDYENKKQNNDLILSSKIGTVLRDKQNNNLPVKSTLNDKNSNIFGELIYNINDNLKIDYDYTLDSKLETFNLHRLTNEAKINNFVNTFSFYEENNIVGNNSYYENTSTFNFNNRNSLSFKTRENKKDNLTEYYKLVYEYENDCLTASIVYNKEYYSNATRKPSEDLFFNITLIPLGSTKTDSLIE